MGEAVAIGVLVVLVFIYLLLMGYLIFAYVMQSLSLHTLAKRRGIANPWLAWLPYGNYWIIGSLARDYDKQKGIGRRWDKLLLILSIVGVASFFVIYIIFFVLIIMLGLQTSNGTLTDEIALEMITPILIVYVFLILVMIAMMALQTLTYVCIFKIFESTVPEKALKYFLIYLLVPFGAPICLFLCRNKGYQHPDPFAYLYAPVNKNYTYYQTNAINPVVENTEQQTTKIEEVSTEEPTNTEE